MNAGAQGRGLDPRRKMGMPGAEQSWVGSGQRAWWAAVLCQVPEGK